MNRWNAEGILRDQLTWALQVKHVVPEFRRRGKCMLCQRPDVNEAGLCIYCMAILDEPEHTLARRWITGAAP